MRINVKVFQAVKRQTKTNKDVFNQVVQIDQADTPSLTISRTYWKEELVLAPGDYTANVKFYTLNHTNTKDGKSFVEQRLAAALGDFQKAK